MALQPRYNDVEALLLAGPKPCDSYQGERFWFIAHFLAPRELTWETLAALCCDSVFLGNLRVVIDFFSRWIPSDDAPSDVRTRWTALREALLKLRHIQCFASMIAAFHRTGPAIATPCPLTRPLEDWETWMQRLAAACEHSEEVMRAAVTRICHDEQLAQQVVHFTEASGRKRAVDEEDKQEPAAKRTGVVDQ